MLLHGHCHCGNLSFTLDWPDPVRVPARTCGCSFCAMHGNVWTSCPDGALRVRCREPDHVTRYAFATRTAEFHLCARCGVVPIASSTIDGKLYAVINVNTFDDVDPALIEPAAIVSFDGESEAARLARRKRAWIADVRFE